MKKTVNLGIKDVFSNEFGKETDSLVFSSPEFELSVSQGGENDVDLVKKLPLNARRDPKINERFHQAHESIRRLGSQYFPLFTRASSPLADLAYRFPADSLSSLSSIIEASASCDTKLPLKVVFSFLLQILEGISLFEQQKAVAIKTTGFVELNPAAIFVDDLGSIYFSHAYFDPPSSVTMSIVGADRYQYLTYCAPERFASRGPIDCRAMAYGFGMLCFELLTGEKLFSNADKSMLDHLIHRKAAHLHPRVSDVDKQLEIFDAIVFDMLHPHPARRFCDYEAVRKRIIESESLIDDDPSSLFSKHMQTLKKILIERVRKPHTVEDAFQEETKIIELNSS